MRSRQHPRVTAAVAIGISAIVAASTIAGCSSSPSTATGSSAGPTAAKKTQVITDMVGRKVTVPLDIKRVVVVGFPPVMDGWIIALGDQKLIVNGFPGYDGSAFYRSDKLLIPDVIAQPNVQSALGGPVNTEELLALHPDVVITSDQDSAEQIQKLGVPALNIDYGSSGPAIEQDVTIMGQLLGKKKEAAAYVAYFDQIIDQVKTTASKVPQSERPSAIYIAIDPLHRPNKIMTWMLGVLGVRDVTAALTDVNSPQFSAEHLYQWNPDVMIVHDPEDVPAFMNGAQYKNLTAVKTKRVDLVPEGINTWGDNTVEQPLGLLWTAKDVYPDLFKDIDLVSETKNFYSRFFGVTLTDQQASDLINSENGL